MPLGFSVVIPLFNKEYIVGRCLESLAEQTRLPDEIIIVNDGSTDGSFSIASSFKEQHPGISITLVDQENAGVSAARNRGVSLASHDLICFLDADDEWKPNFIEVMESLIIDYPNAVLYCLGHEVVNDKGEVKAVRHGCPTGFRGYVEDFFKASTKGSVANSSKVCVKKRALTEVGGFPEGVVAGEDVVVWLSISLKGRVACDSRTCAIVNRFEDNSRKSRRNSVPYAVVFFTEGNQRKVVGDNMWLKYYLSKMILKDIANSISQGVYSEARLRLNAAGRFDKMLYLVGLPLFILPPVFYRMLKK